MESAVYKGASIQEGKIDQLHIGMSSVINIMPELLPLLREFKKQNPQIEITISKTDDNNSLKKLHTQEQDILFQYVAPEMNGG